MPFRITAIRLFAGAAVACAALGAAGCGGSPSRAVATLGPTTTSTTQTTTTLPGSGKPPVMIGDKNYTEQFVLGELYYLALQGDGFNVSLNRNIGATQVTLQALKSGQLGMYPEYLNVWNTAVAGDSRAFATRPAAYRAAQGYALSHGMALLNPTPFSDTDAIAVTVSYAQHYHLHSISDLRGVATGLTLGAPPQFEQAPTGLPALEQTYGFTPAAVQPMEIGAQYQALDQNTVQAADVNTTDGELTTGNYALLADPKRVLGIGNVVPVVTDRVLAAEGPAFVDTVDRVTALLTLAAIRELNAAVDIAGQDPAAVAKRFLIDHGVLPPPNGS